MKIITLFFFQLLYTACFSQDINGVWNGKMFKKNDTLILKLEISLDDDYTISGYMTTFLGNGQYGKTKIFGNFNKKKSLYIFSETQVVKTTSHEMQIILQKFSLRYDAKNDELIGTAECTRGGCYEIYEIGLLRYQKN